MFKRLIAIMLFFTLAVAAAPSLDSVSASGSTYYAKIDSGNLNVRKSASTNGAIVTKVAKGKQFTVHSQTKGWAHVTANGKKGYVSSKYIAPVKNAKKTSTSAPASDYRSKAVSAAKKNLGAKYVWGGNTPKGFDCSGFVSYSYAQAGKTLPRSSTEMYKKGTAVTSLIPGDLVFYATSGGKKVSHVAIYIGNGQVIHSITGGVKITNMNNSYWKTRYVGAKRI